MKTNILSLLAIAGLLTFAGCASDDTANKDNDQEPGTEGLTSFVEEDNSTRTTAEYDGSGLNFYWTEGDRLWVNTGTALAPALTQDSKNNISNLLVPNPTTPIGVKRAAKASFAFAGTYTASSYPVRYTGKGNADGNKVKIKAAQSQTIPNDASHIGEDGDFGVALAQKQSDNKYHFILDHKAAYVTFMPYTTQSWGPNAVIQKIRVYTGNTADALAGTFDLADDGTLSNAAGTSNSVELTVPDFSIPGAFSHTANGATMVVNPGTYNNVSIEFTLHDQVSNVTSTITKTYPSAAFAAGKNKKVKINLQIKEPFQGLYYMWDAAVGQHYWAGHLDADGKPDNKDNYPQTSTDPRWYRVDTSTPCPPASRSAKDCPNVNECVWYCKQGDPHWDDQTLWTLYGHLYKGGIWLKKKANIPGFTASNYNGTDYRIGNISNMNYSVTQGKPSNPNDYFYLPALGRYYGAGVLPFEIGVRGYYWTSTPILTGRYTAFDLNFNPHYVNVYSYPREAGFPLLKAQ